MERRNYFFYPGLAFWLIALLTWWFFATFWALAAAGLALASFFIHGFQRQIFSMFSKNKKPDSRAPLGVVPSPVSTTLPEQVAKPATIAEEKPANTVIASGVRLTGDVSGSGQIYVYGEVEGNVDAGDGLVKVMRNGHVRGNISGRELIIDGQIHGECTAESVSIEEHGNINGALAYGTLTVKKGGIFVGSMAQLAVSQPQTNVIGFHSEAIATAPETVVEVSAFAPTAPQTESAPVVQTRKNR